MAEPDIFWTAERCMILRECRDEGMHADDIAAKLGTTSSAVRSRAARMGIAFVKQKTRRKARANPRREGHKAADEKSAELLRAAGVDIG